LWGSTGDIGCARCAYRVNGGTSWRLGKQGVEVAEILVQFLEPARVDGRSSAFDGQGQLGLAMFEFTFEDLTSTGDGVSLVVEQAFDAQGHFDVAATVEALAGAAFVRLELRELALPETEDVGGDVAEFGNLADAEVELVRDVGPGGWGGFADWLVLRHARAPRTACPAGVAYGPAAASIGHS
jgi:hypothetical protein